MTTDHFGRGARDFDIKALISEWEGRNYALHEAHVNPQFAKVLKTIGFDRCYVRASGPHLWDIEGTQYLDLTAGYGVFNLGRNHPQIRQSIEDFLDREYPSLVQLEAPLLSGLLAAELKKHTPEGLGKVYFTNSGTEGVETAIKLARGATRRPTVLYCRKAFHGLTTGALSLNGDETFREGFDPFLPGCRSIPFNDLAALEEALSAGDVAAFIVEPIQGKGVNIPDPGYLAEAANLCRRHGALFIADEVQTGIGRTGRFLAIDHEPGVEPDILVLSKALSGGYMPVGAVLMRDWIYERVFSSLERAVVHSSTFGQNSLAMAAGLATLHVVDELDLPGHAARMGDMIGEELRAMQPRFEFLKDVRWRGLMIGIEFGEPQSLGLRTAWSMVHKMDKNLFPQAVTMPLLHDHRIVTQVAGHNIDVIKLLPPLVIDEKDARWFLSSFEKVMADLHRFPGPAWDVLKRIGRVAVTSRARRAPDSAVEPESRPAVAARSVSAAATPSSPTGPVAALRPAEQPSGTAVAPPASWVHRAARWTVRPLVNSPVTPNHLTTIRLVTGLAAAGAFMVGESLWTFIGGVLFVISAFLDRADGELARLRRQTSRTGHLYDLVSDGVVTTVTFFAIGIGLSHSFESYWPIILGGIAGSAIAALFIMVAVIEARSRDASFSGGRFDPDDILFVIGPLAWLDELWPLLMASAAGAPLFGLWILYRFWCVLFRPAH